MEISPIFRIFSLFVGIICGTHAVCTDSSAPAAPLHGRKIRLFENEYAIYRCIDGFHLQSGQEGIIWCDPETNKWTGNPGNCIQGNSATTTRVTEGSTQGITTRKTARSTATAAAPHVGCLRSLAPQAPPNMYLLQVLPHDAVIYACLTGFTFTSGSYGLLWCRKNRWSGDIGTCSPIAFGDMGVCNIFQLPSPSDLSRLLRLINGVAQYECLPGYAFARGADATVKCDRMTRRWIGLPGRCLSIASLLSMSGSCSGRDIPAPPVNGRIESISPGVEVTYNCRPGFRLITFTEKTAFCNQTTSRWSNVSVLCTLPDAVFCSAGNLPTLRNNSVVIQLIENVLVRYQCVAGFAFQLGISDFVVLCSLNGWEKKEIPTCTPIIAQSECTQENAPKTPENVLRVVNLGERVTYRCLPGFTTVTKFNVQILICNPETNRWNIENILPCTESVEDHGGCTKELTPTLPNASRHTVTEGSNVTYLCISGFLTADGRNIVVIVCDRETKTWINRGDSLGCSNVNVGECHAAKAPTDVLNSIRVSVSEGDAAHYACLPGFSTPNDRLTVNILCLNKEWDKNYEKCTKELASHLCTRVRTPSIDNAVRTKVIEGDSVIYACREGFSTPLGETVFAVKCSKSTMTWNTEFSSCQRTLKNFARCTAELAPTDLDNAHRVSVQEGQSVTFRCIDDHRTTAGGNTVVIACDKLTGSWNSDVDICSREAVSQTAGTCTMQYSPTNIDNARRTEVVEGDRVVFKCLPGYKTQNRETSIIIHCDRIRRMWNSNFESCSISEGSQCLPNMSPVAPRNSVRTSIVNGQYITYRCLQGYVTQHGNAQIVIRCIDNSWQSTVLSCSTVNLQSRCTRTFLPITPENTRIVTVVDQQYISYACLDGFRTQLESLSFNVNCIANQWDSHHTSCSISTNRCNAASAPPIPANSERTELVEGSLATYTCLPGFRSTTGLKYFTITCENGQWNHFNFECISHM